MECGHKSLEQHACKMSESLKQLLGNRLVCPVYCTVVTCFIARRYKMCPCCSTEFTFIMCDEVGTTLRAISCLVCRKEGPLSDTLKGAVEMWNRERTGQRWS